MERWIAHYVRRALVRCRSRTARSLVYCLERSRPLEIGAQRPALLVPRPSHPQHCRHPGDPLPFCLCQLQAQTRIRSAQEKEKVNLLQSSCHAAAMREIGWCVYGPPGQQIYYKALGPFCVAKYQRPTRLDPSYLKKFRTRFHPLITIIEPNSEVTGLAGLPLSPFAHSATAILNLKQSEAELLNSFSGKTRYNISYATRKNQLKVSYFPLAVLSEQARANFFTLCLSWNNLKGGVGHDARFLSAILSGYREHGYLHLAYQAKTPVAALLTLDCDQIATYYTAFSTPAGNHHYAPTLLTYLSILKAKELGCHTYDFGGVFDPRYPKRYRGWEGFTRFKAGFNPTPLEYPPSRLLFLW